MEKKTKKNFYGCHDKGLLGSFENNENSSERTTLVD